MSVFSSVTFLIADLSILCLPNPIEIKEGLLRRFSVRQSRPEERVGNVACNGPHRLFRAV